MIDRYRGAKVADRSAAGVVEWWSGGVVEWWSGGVVEWWSGGETGAMPDLIGGLAVLVQIGTVAVDSEAP